MKTRHKAILAVSTTGTLLGVALFGFYLIEVRLLRYECSFFSKYSKVLYRRNNATTRQYSIRTAAETLSANFCFSDVVAVLRSESTLGSQSKCITVLTRYTKRRPPRIVDVSEYTSITGGYVLSTEDLLTIFLANRIMHIEPTIRGPGDKKRRLASIARNTEYIRRIYDGRCAAAHVLILLDEETTYCEISWYLDRLNVLDSVKLAVRGCRGGRS